MPCKEAKIKLKLSYKVDLRLRIHDVRFRRLDAQ